MTTQARLVLEDCRGALAELTDNVFADQWRRRWVVTVVLLRAVGHVLKSIDSRQSPAMKAAIKSGWRSINDENASIFSDFIENERNLVVKEYEINAGYNITLYPGENRPSEYDYVINNGPFKGMLQTELVSMAIAWWEKHLNAIDAEAAKAT